MKRKEFLKGLFFTSFVSSAFAASKDSGDFKRTSILDYGAKGDGKSDDSKAFEEYLKQHQSLNLPENKIFKVGNVVLEEKTINGPGKVIMAPGSKSTFILEGKNNRLENIHFLSEGKGTRPEAEIILGKQLENATVKGCFFEGKLFTTIGSELNDTKDAPYKDLPWRTKLIISECFFKGSYAHHLYLHRLKDVIIQSNFFEASGLDSIRLRQWVQNINISNNHFKDIGLSKSSDSKDAIDCYWSGHNLNIQGNQFENITTHGLDIKGHSPDQDYGTSKVIISNNHFRGVGFSGILISSGAKTMKGWKAIKNITVSNNMIEGCGTKTQNPNDAAIFMRHNQEQILVEGNQIFQNKHKGVMLGNFEKDAENSKNILIMGNIITANGSYGIHISGGENVLVSGNILDKNEKGVVAENYRNFKLTNYKASENIES